MERGVKTTLDRWLDKNGLPMRPPQAGGGDVPTGASYGKVKKGNSLIDEMNRRIEKLKDDMNEVKQKIKAIDAENK